jgi:DNA-binding transcriptional LysR family regulator
MLLIGFSTSAMCAYLPSILRRFHEAHPSIGLQFTEFLTDDSVVDALRQNQIDLGCIQRCLRVDTIESFLLKQIPVVVALNHKHRLASSSSIRLRELVYDANADTLQLFARRQYSSLTEVRRHQPQDWLSRRKFFV